MFKAVCSECGKECEIPFKPTEGRPVKCNDCFRKGRGGSGRGRERGSRFVLNVERQRRFRLNQYKANLFSVGIVSKKLLNEFRLTE